MINESEEKPDFGKTKLLSSISTIYDSFLTLVYPQACRLCEKSVESNTKGVVCDECWQKSRIFTGNEALCHKCGAFLKESISEFQAFCGRCQDDSYDLARAVGSYQKALLISILRLKKQPFIPKHLEELLFAAFKQAPFQDVNRIIPVPLSKIRLAERGFNQATLIAKSLAEQAGLILDEQSFQRVIHTEKHRAGMDKKARHESVKKAFEVLYPRLIEGENILLVDDVLTSGSTVSVCAKILKENGANKVYVLTIARAV